MKEHFVKDYLVIPKAKSSDKFVWFKLEKGEENI